MITMEESSNAQQSTEKKKLLTPQAIVILSFTLTLSFSMITFFYAKNGDMMAVAYALVALFSERVMLLHAQQIKK